MGKLPLDKKTAHEVAEIIVQYSVGILKWSKNVIQIQRMSNEKSELYPSQNQDKQ